jgi:RNA polymerase sigma factor for flagellar operon FliA
MIKKIFDEEKLAKLWIEYKSNPNPVLKATLAESYYPIVKKLVAGFVHKKPNVLDYEDLVQAGNMGLLDAIEKFDPSRGNLFQTYATIRVRGSILDEINSMDWTPRSVRENIKGIIKSIEGHYENSQSEPTVGDIAERSNLEVDETRSILIQMNRTFMVHVEPETIDIIGPTTDERQSELETTIKYVMEKELTVEERKFIDLKFFKGYSNKEIMTMMGISINSLRIIKESAITKLTGALEGYEGF